MAFLVCVLLLTNGLCLYALARLAPVPRPGAWTATAFTCIGLGLGGLMFAAAAL